MDQKTYLNRSWRFSEQFSENMIQQYMGDAGNEVTIPHTCKETPYDYFDESIYQMVSCYQKELMLDDSFDGKVLLLTFEGIGHKSDVYVNGEHVASHDCGYTAFTIDITKYVVFHKANLITVKVDSNELINQPPFGFVIDYMTYGGIYRDVYLEAKEMYYIEDVYHKPFVDENVDTNDLSPKEIATITGNATLKSDIYLSRQAANDFEQKEFIVRQYVNDELIVQENITKYQEKYTLETELNKIQLWDVESPKLYMVRTELILEGSICDIYETKIGFRRAVFKKDGFYLNGRKLKIRGLNRHQSFPYVGYAMPESMQRQDARILKYELGANAVRTSHYPQSHDFVDECDEIGLLVFTEIPGWQHIGDDTWKDIAVENVTDMVKQYRNHTSIILWGVRINESKDDDAFYERTNAAARLEDETRQTGGVRCHKRSNLLEDVYTYNDFSHCGNNQGCDKKKDVTSNVDKAYLISEYNGHMFPTKSFDPEEHRLEHAIRHAKVLEDVAANDDIAGAFAWCMFDYNTHKDFGSGDRICYHGVMDMFRNPKMAAAVYASQAEEDVVLELSSSMDIGEHPACNRGSTYIFSNADSVRMYKNQILLKEYTKEDSSFKHLSHGPILIDDYVGDELTKENFSKHQTKLVKYCLNYYTLHGMKLSPKLIWSVLQLVTIYHMNMEQAYHLYNRYVGNWGGESMQYRFDAIKDGKVVKSLIKTPMRKTCLQANISDDVLNETHTYDVAEIRVSVTDEYHNLLNFFSEILEIETDGPIEVIGPDHIPFRGGMTGIYVKSKGVSGPATITLKCPGCETLTIQLKVQCEA